MATIRQRNLAREIKVIQPGSLELKEIKNQVIPSVYVIRCKEFYKIGYTTCLERRLDALISSNPFNLEVVYVIQTERHKELEKALHEFLSDRRWKREWFKLLPEDEKGLEDFIASYLYANK